MNQRKGDKKRITFWVNMWKITPIKNIRRHKNNCTATFKSRINEREINLALTLYLNT